MLLLLWVAAPSSMGPRRHQASGVRCPPFLLPVWEPWKTQQGERGSLVGMGIDGPGDQGRARAREDSLTGKSHQIMVPRSHWGSGLAAGGSPGEGDLSGSGGLLSQGRAGSNPPMLSILPPFPSGHHHLNGDSRSWWGPGGAACPGLDGGDLAQEHGGVAAPTLSTGVGHAPSFAFPACPALPAPQLSPCSSCGPSSPKLWSVGHFEDAASPSCHASSPFALSLCPLEWLSPSGPPSACMSVCLCRPATAPWGRDG